MWSGGNYVERWNYGRAVETTVETTVENLLPKMFGGLEATVD
jgi:hypothetical protein